MIVDFHTHTFPDSIAARAVGHLAENSHTLPFLDGTAGALAESRRAAGIDRCVVLPVATSARQVPHINDAAIRMNETAEDTGLYSLGAMHPDFPDWREELKRLQKARVRGIKLHPPYQGVPFDDKRYVRILSLAGELGLFTVIHAGLDVGLPGNDSAVPRRIANALRAAGPVTLVCAHMGGWRRWEEAKTLLPPLGVYIDTAFSFGRITPLGDDHPWREEELQMLDDARMAEMIRAFGPRRVLFGTDSPWMDQAEQIRRLQALPLSDMEKAAVSGGNAARLMGWESI